MTKGSVKERKTFYRMSMGRYWLSWKIQLSYCDEVILPRKYGDVVTGSQSVRL